jgi:hypothetical protein
MSASEEVEVVGSVMGVPLSGGLLAPVLITSVVDAVPAFSAEWSSENVLVRAEEDGREGAGGAEAAAAEAAAPWRAWTEPEPRSVHMLSSPLFDGPFAARIIASAEAHAAGGAGWTTRRHAVYATCDIPVSTITGVSAEVFARLEAALMPAIASMYGLRKQRLSLRDVFVVKYDATEGGEGGGGVVAGAAAQRGLAMHEDGSDFSFNALLSDPGAFDGGGTRFEGRFGGSAVRVGRGEVLIHAGALRHEGVAITRGRRYLCVGFLKYRGKPPGGGVLAAGPSAAASEDS